MLEMRLIEINSHECCTVKEIKLEATTQRRLEALGMTVGAKIQIMRKKSNGAVIIKLRGTRFALGKEIASGIIVEREKVQC